MYINLAIFVFNVSRTAGFVLIYKKSGEEPIKPPHELQLYICRVVKNSKERIISSEALSVTPY